MRTAALLYLIIGEIVIIRALSNPLFVQRIRIGNPSPAVVFTGFMFLLPFWLFFFIKVKGSKS